MTDAHPLSLGNMPAALQNAIQRYDSFNEQNMLEQQAKDVVSQPLYQYTNAAGLKGIFDSQQMWFTDYRFLNDPSELRHGMDTARELLLKAQSGLDGRACLLLQCVTDMFCHDNIEASLAFFVASFSHARDDLGQWRAYADNGRGFAIGFAPYMFSIQKVSRLSPDENAFLGSVRYGTADALNRNLLAIQEAVRIFLTTVDDNAALMEGDKATGTAFIQEFSRHLIASPLIWNALTFKHPAYAYEREVRLVMIGVADNLRSFIQTRLRGSEIVPYIPHPWNVREPSAVVEVLVGPAAPAGAEAAVRTMLARYGLKELAVERSDIPYRST